VKSFNDYLKEQDMVRTPTNPRESLDDAIALISNLTPAELEDSKDKLLELQQMLEDVLSGNS
jgi:hypothetical protein